MDVTITPHPLSGETKAIASKSVAHRLLILAALADGITDIDCNSLSDDIRATMRCLTALGASVARTHDGFRVVPLRVRGTKPHARLDVGESGSTLRFLLPVVGALGKGASFSRSGRLSQRPLSPLDDRIREHGCTLSDASHDPLTLEGTLVGGSFDLPGNISSQYASGLLMAAPLMRDDVEIVLREPVESLGYIGLTLSALDTFGVRVASERSATDEGAFRRYAIAGGTTLHTPGLCTVEGDWSNAAFWLAAGALGGEGLVVRGVDLQSRQGDRAIMAALTMVGACVGRSRGEVGCHHEYLQARDIDVSGVPDLVPPLAAMAAYARGTSRLSNAGRLRLKESDRLETVRDTVVSLGGRASISGDDLLIEGVEHLAGGTVEAHNDHRIAMMAAICAAYADGPTTIRGAQCVSKSYPQFFDDFRRLGGIAQESEG